MYHPACWVVFSATAALLFIPAPSRMLGRQKILANEYLLKWMESTMGSLMNLFASHGICAFDSPVAQLI
ncbi:Pre-mRNA cleavage complex 2 protein Pcf11 [Manis javanica]|nr:Pre-mRNA cleavage complex 2 protein Pcf11 [Manis javanica]